ncbi:MAG: sulfotransferase, partial [Mycobacterium sp.]
MTLSERFSPERLIATACEEAGSDDFGCDSWQPGLERVADGLVNDARLSVIGVEVAYLDVMRALK